MRAHLLALDSVQVKERDVVSLRDGVAADDHVERQLVAQLALLARQTSLLPARAMTSQLCANRFTQT